MPFDAFNRWRQAEQEQRAAQGQADPNGGVHIGGVWGSSSPTPGAAPAVGPSAAAPAPTGGSAGNTNGRFVSFGRLFDLNKDKSKAEAGSVIGGVQQQANTATNALNQRIGEFNGQVAAGTVRGGTLEMPDPYQRRTADQGTGVSRSSGSMPLSDQNTPTRPGVVDPATGQTVGGNQPRPAPASPPAAAPPVSLGGPAGYVPGAQPGAQPSAPPPQQASSMFSGFRKRDFGKGPSLSQAQAQAAANGHYSGPADLGDTTALAAQFGRVEQQGTGLGNSAGLQSDLGSQYGALGYSPTADTGNGRFDAALMGVAAAPELQSAANRFKGFADKVGVANSEAATRATAAGALSAQNAASARQQLGQLDQANANNALNQSRDAAFWTRQREAQDQRSQDGQFAQAQANADQQWQQYQHDHPAWTGGTIGDPGNQAPPPANAEAVMSATGLGPHGYAAAIYGLTPDQQARLDAGTAEGDPEKYLGKGWLAWHARQNGYDPTGEPPPPPWLQP